MKKKKAVKSLQCIVLSSFLLLQTVACGSQDAAGDTISEKMRMSRRMEHKMRKKRRHKI